MTVDGQVERRQARIEARLVPLWKWWNCFGNDGTAQDGHVSRTLQNPASPLGCEGRMSTLSKTRAGKRRRRRGHRRYVARQPVSEGQKRLGGSRLATTTAKRCGSRLRPHRREQDSLSTAGRRALGPQPVVA